MHQDTDFYDFFLRQAHVLVAGYRAHRCFGSTLASALQIPQRGNPYSKQEQMPGNSKP